MIAVSVLSVAGCVLQIVLLAKDMSIGIIIGNGVLLVIAVVYAIIRYKTGKVNMEISYESK